ncbi:transposase [Salmonella enterica subsp. enterica serovar Derby]|nr:transposase [Salmonella enterica subsp. enterica serovar Derby]
MGHSISEVVQALGFSRATVSRVYREYIDSGKTIPARANCRGQQRVDERGHRRLARIVTADRRATVQEITRQFNAGALKRVSSHTIQNHLLAMGYRSHRPTRVPQRTAHHRAQRLAWVREHHPWTLDMWKNVAWTDESRFTLVHADGRVRVRRKPHEAMDPSCQQGTLQAGGGGILVWGLFTWTEMGPLVRVTSSLTGQRYREILDDHVLPFVRLQHPTGDLSLQQDNAPCHRSRIVSEWLDEHSSDVTSLPWPARSPDLNIIEHIWDAIERDVRGSDPLHQIFVNCGSLFRGRGSVWLPNASGVLSSPCRDESTPSAV